MTLSVAAAEALTEKVRTNATDLARLIKQAHEEQVWLPLGYSSFTAWVEGELEWSHTRGFQLLSIASLSDELAESVPLPEGFTLTDLQTRAIISIGRAEFIDRLVMEAGEAHSENISIIGKLIREMSSAPPSSSTRGGTPLNLTPAVPRFVAGGVYNSRTLLSHAGSLVQRLSFLPSKASLLPDTVKTGLGLLNETREILIARRDEYEKFRAEQKGQKSA